MYAKTAILLSGFAALYVLLVFVARTWAEGVALAVLVGLFAAGIGLNVQHDGGHRAFSRHAWVNRLMAMTLEPQYPAASVRPRRRWARASAQQAHPSRPTMPVAA
jgi:fatty acid desaturase